MKLYRMFFKRLIDVSLALIALLLLLPVIIVVSIIVKIKIGSPIIFVQSRPGLNEKIFNIYKFRTMTNEVSENGELLPDTIRLNAIGRTLRSLSLDEIPSLVNIIKGDMSLVGPRPLAVQYLPYYTHEERMRHSVRPGLTGLAQINGRNGLNWEEKFKYDIQYVNNISFSLDFKIMFFTFFKVIQRSNIGERGIDSPIDFDKYRQNQ